MSERMPAPNALPSAAHRRWLRVTLFGVLGLVGALLLAWLWIFHTASGRNFVLARVIAALPQSASGQAALQIGAASGSLADLQLHDIRFRLDDGVQLRVAEAELAFVPSALFGLQLTIERLALQGAVLQLQPTAATDEAQAPTAWQWPDLQPPLAFTIKQFSIRDGRLLDAAGQQLLRLDALQLGGALDRNGQLQITQLAMRSSYGVLGSHADLDLDGNANGELAANWRGADTQAALQLQAKVRNNQLTLSLNTPVDKSQRLDLRIGRDGWALQSRLDQFDLGAWWPQAAGPLTANFTAAGQGSSATLSGDFAYAGQTVHLTESQLQLNPDASALTLSPLIASSPQGKLEARGQLALRAGMPHHLSLQLADVRLPLGESDEARLSAQAELGGQFDAWTLQLDGQLQQATQSLPLRLQASGDLAAATIQQWQLGDADAQLAGHGRLAWLPALALQLRLQLHNFDPARIDPRLPGRLQGALDLRIHEQPSGLALDLNLDDLNGRLLDQALHGRGEVHWGANAGDSRLQLTWGGSVIHAEGHAGNTPALRIDLSPLQLDQLPLDVSGSLRGSLQLRDARLRANLTGEQLSYQQWQLGRLSLDADLSDSDSDSDSSELQLELGALRHADQRFEKASLHISGTRADHRMVFALTGEPLSVALTAAGAWQDTNWQGRIDQLDLSPASGPAWQLQQAALLRVADGQLHWSPSCLLGGAAQVCVQAEADAGAQNLAVSLKAFPLAALQPWLADPSGLALNLDGQLNAELSLQRSDTALQAELHFDSSNGRLSHALNPQHSLLDWQHLQGQARLDAQQLHLSVDGALGDGGQLQLALDGGSPLQADAAAQAIHGQLRLTLPQLRALALVEPHLADSRGQLQARIDVGGQWSAPQLSGELALRDFNAEVPALGIRIRDSRLSVASSDGQQLQIDGEVHSGEGALSIHGQFDPQAAGERGRIQVRGERVRVSNTALLQLLVSPDLALHWHADQGLRLDGRIGLPEGRLDLERIQSSVSPSPDVVVSDPRPGQDSAPGLPIHADVRLQLGPAMQLRGFGFNGRIDGELAIKERPGHSPTGSGALNVSGKYHAYGQDLDIQRGRLLFSNTTLDNPGLDVRAERRFKQQTVGLKVAGSALLPILDVYAEPALAQAEALSYLVLGRPLRSASNADGNELSQAAAAIGGDLLAGQLGARLGLDINVGNSEALGETALSVGKYLSPRLYLGYGVSLFGSGRVISFKYLINQLWEIEIESGSENRVGLNYTLEH